MIAPVPKPVSLTGYEGTADEHWYMVGVPAKSQGWKLYVTATVSNYLTTVRATAEILHSEGVSFKYLRSVARVRDMNAGLHGFSQIGMCIVAYLEDISRVPSIVERLHGALLAIGHTGPFVPRLPRVCAGSAMFYRFGSYGSRSLRLHDKEVKDDRLNPRAAIDIAGTDPFAAYSRVTEQKANAQRSILAHYPVVSTICKSGKGGVFNAVRSLPHSEADAEFVAKLGLRGGQSLPDGRDGAHFLAQEFAMYTSFADAGLGNILPIPIAYAEEEEANVLILQKIKGENLAVLRHRGVANTTLLLGALDLIRGVHAAGFFLRDAKTANFMEANGRLFLIDLESAGRIDADLPCKAPSTFDLKVPELASPEHWDIIHFLVSALYKGDPPGCSLSVTRKIDVLQLVAQVDTEDEWDRAAASTLRHTLKTMHQSR